MRCACAAFALRMRCVCAVFALCLRCVRAAFAIAAVESELSPHEMKMKEEKKKCDYIANAKRTHIERILNASIAKA
jgi:hypothetical protein